MEALQRLSFGDLATLCQDQGHLASFIQHLARKGDNPYVTESACACTSYYSSWQVHKTAATPQFWLYKLSNLVWRTYLVAQWLDGTPRYRVLTSVVFARV